VEATNTLETAKILPLSCASDDSVIVITDYKNNSDTINKWNYFQNTLIHNASISRDSFSSIDILSSYILLYN